MGCGKSTVGRELHKRLGYPHTDTDQRIEERVGRKITEIFQEEGEAFFRELETRQLVEMGAETGTRHIISTGGGIVIAPGNRQLLRGLGYVVWLYAPEEEIQRRTGKSSERPLLNQAGGREKIGELMAEREPWYREAAHLKIDTRGLESDEVATGILESARYYFSQLA